MPRKKQQMQDEDMEQLLQKLLKTQNQHASPLGSDSELESEGSFFEGEGSVCSMPEMKDLKNVVFGRYETYHPKSLIADEEKLITLYLREFNNAFCDLEEEFEDEEDNISMQILDLQEDLKGLSKRKMRKRGTNIKSYEKKKKKEIELLEENQKQMKRIFLKKKDALEKFYCQMCKNAIEQHPEPPPELTSILKLLDKNASCLHAICLHLSHFSYIDSELEEGSEDELASMDGDDDSDSEEEEMPTLPNLTQESLNFQFGKRTTNSSSSSLAYNASSESEASEESGGLKNESSSSKAT